MDLETSKLPLGEGGHVESLVNRVSHYIDGRPEMLFSLSPEEKELVINKSIHGSWGRVADVDVNISACHAAAEWDCAGDILEGVGNRDASALRSARDCLLEMVEFYRDESVSPGLPQASFSEFGHADRSFESIATALLRERLTQPRWERNRGRLHFLIGARSYCVSLPYSTVVMPFPQTARNTQAFLADPLRFLSEHWRAWQASPSIRQALRLADGLAVAAAGESLRYASLQQLHAISTATSEAAAKALGMGAAAYIVLESLGVSSAEAGAAQAFLIAGLYEGAWALFRREREALGRGDTE